MTTPGLPEHDASKTNAEQGLYRKFDVRRLDGSDEPGGKHYGCEYFVLDLTHDPHAPAALRAYAQACAHTHPPLSADLQQRYGTVPADAPAVGQEAGLIPERDRAWKQAVDAELVTLGSTADSFASPREAVEALVKWHVEVALDPAVSSAAQALIDRGAAGASATVKDDDPLTVDLPERVIDTLYQAAGVDTYHPDGDQQEKLYLFARGVVAETLARLPSLSAAVAQAGAAQEAGLTEAQREQLELIERSDPSFVLRHLRERTAFDVSVVERMFELAKERARALLAHNALAPPPGLTVDQAMACFREVLISRKWAVTAGEISELLESARAEIARDDPAPGLTSDAS